MSKKKKKRQHFVQAAYLKNFAVDPTQKREKREIWVAETKNIKIDIIDKPKKIDKLSMEFHFLNTNVDGLLSEIEDLHFPAIQQIVDIGSLNDGLGDLYIYMGYQRKRGRYWRDVMKIFDPKNQNDLKKLQEQQFYPSIPNPHPTGSPADIYLEKLGSEISEVEVEICDMINETNMILFVNKTSHNFVTSDNPVVPSFDGEGYVEINGEVIACEILFSLSPKIAVVLILKTEINPHLSPVEFEISNKEEIMVLNKKIAEYSNKEIYAKEKDDLVKLRNFILKQKVRTG